MEVTSNVKLRYRQELTINLYRHDLKLAVEERILCYFYLKEFQVLEGCISYKIANYTAKIELIINLKKKITLNHLNDQSKSNDKNSATNQSSNQKTKTVSLFWLFIERIKKNLCICKCTQSENIIIFLALRQIRIIQTYTKRKLY